MYSDCLFPRCNRPVATGLDLPLCPKHCRKVYLTVKDLVDAAEQPLEPERKSSARPLQSKRTGVVYFARMGDLIKIGFTTNLTQRMASLGADEVLATTPGTMQTEKAIHARFGPMWERGELFRPEPELLDFIQSLGHAA